MDQETQQQPPVEIGQASGAAGNKAKAVAIDYHAQQIKMIIDLLATGGYTQSMLYEVRASGQGREGVGELLLSDVQAKETEHGNSELTVVFSGNLKEELAKNNTLIDGDKFKHAYYRLDWEEEAKRIRGDLRTPPELEIDGYRMVSLLSLDKVMGPGFTNTGRLSDLFVHDFYPDKLKKIRAGDIDTEESIFKGIGALLRASGKRFVSGNEVNVDLSSFAHSTEKPGIGLFEFTAPFTQLDILKWFYFGITDVERKIFIVFDLAQIGKTTHYERSENRVPQIGHFTFFESSPGTLREDDPNKLKVADLTTAEPYNVPLTLSIDSDELDTFGLNHDLGILMVNNIVMYNNQYGKPFDRLGDHLANQSNAFSDIGFQYDDVGEGVEADPELIGAVANIPGYEDTTNLSSRVVGVRFRNDITLAQAYANKTGIIGNWVIPVEKANLANEFLGRLKNTPKLKENIIEYEAFEGAKDTNIFEASFTGDKNQDVAVIVKSTTTMLEVDDSKHNKITTSVDESTFLPHVKQIVKAMFNLEFPIVDIVEDTEYEHEHAKVYEIKPKAVFANVSTGKKIRLVYMKAENPSASEEEGKETPKPQEGGTEEQPSPPASGEEGQPSSPQGETEGQAGGLVTELSGFTPPNS